MADIKNKNELKRRTELFLDEFSHEEYMSNEDFCKDTMRMMREFIGRACHLLDCKHKQVMKLQRTLKTYEDAEEQGLLLRLPCKVGDTVYELQEIRKRIQPMEIISVNIGRMGLVYFNWELKDGIGIYHNIKGFGASQIGKTVFLTREEAEQALAEMQKG